MRASRERWRITAIREKQKGEYLAAGEEVAREIELELEGHGKRLRGLSVRSKVAIAEEVERILQELKEAPGMGAAVRSRCLAALASICQKLHRWDEEPLPANPGIVPAINMRLIRTKPAELRELAQQKKLGDVEKGNKTAAY